MKSKEDNQISTAFWDSCSLTGEANDIEVQSLDYVDNDISWTESIQSATDIQEEPGLVATDSPVITQALSLSPVLSDAHMERVLAVQADILSKWHEQGMSPEDMRWSYLFPILTAAEAKERENQLAIRHNILSDLKKQLAACPQQLVEALDLEQQQQLVIAASLQVTKLQLTKLQQEYWHHQNSQEQRLRAAIQQRAQERECYQQQQETLAEQFSLLQNRGEDTLTLQAQQEFVTIAEQTSEEQYQIVQAEVESFHQDFETQEQQLLAEIKRLTAESNNTTVSTKLQQRQQRLQRAVASETAKIAHDKKQLSLYHKGQLASAYDTIVLWLDTLDNREVTDRQYAGVLSVLHDLFIPTSPERAALDQWVTAINPYPVAEKLLQLRIYGKYLLWNQGNDFVANPLMPVLTELTKVDVANTVDEASAAPLLAASERCYFQLQQCMVPPVALTDVIKIFSARAYINGFDYRQYQLFKNNVTTIGASEWSEIPEEMDRNPDESVVLKQQCAHLLRHADAIKTHAGEFAAAAKASVKKEGSMDALISLAELDALISLAESALEQAGSAIEQRKAALKQFVQLTAHNPLKERYEQITLYVAYLLETDPRGSVNEGLNNILKSFQHVAHTPGDAADKALCEASLKWFKHISQAACYYDPAAATDVILPAMINQFKVLTPVPAMSQLQSYSAYLQDLASRLETLGYNDTDRGMITYALNMVASVFTHSSNLSNILSSLMSAVASRKTDDQQEAQQSLERYRIHHGQTKDAFTQEVLVHLTALYEEAAKSEQDSNVRQFQQFLDQQQADCYAPIKVALVEYAAQFGFSHAVLKACTVGGSKDVGDIKIKAALLEELLAYTNAFVKEGDRAHWQTLLAEDLAAAFKTMNQKLEYKLDVRGLWALLHQAQVEDGQQETLGILKGALAQWLQPQAGSEEKMPALDVVKTGCLKLRLSLPSESAQSIAIHVYRDLAVEAVQAFLMQQLRAKKWLTPDGSVAVKHQQEASQWLRLHAGSFLKGQPLTEAGVVNFRTHIGTVAELLGDVNKVYRSYQSAEQKALLKVLKPLGMEYNKKAKALQATGKFTAKISKWDAYQFLAGTNSVVESDAMPIATGNSTARARSVSARTMDSGVSSATPLANIMMHRPEDTHSVDSGIPADDGHSVVSVGSDHSGDSGILTAQRNNPACVIIATKEQAVRHHHNEAGLSVAS